MAAQSASSNKADSPHFTPGSPTGVPTLVVDHPNQWCVEGHHPVYSDAMFLNDKGVMTRTLRLERRVLKRSLPNMPNMHTLFTIHRLEWIARSLSPLSEELV